MTLAARPVLPAEIQNALTQIWESLETNNVARACLFNLIFYTQKDHRTSYIQRLAQSVIEKFPSRVIFITIDKESKEDKLSTSVSILSSSKGEFDVACDYIQIDASGSLDVRVPFVVLPHILADLPVFLIFAEDPGHEDPLYYPLQQFANRLIFDSETTDNLPRFALNLLAHQKKSNCDIADLNWARIESWREVLSLAFHSDQSLSKVQRSKKITLTYNAQETAFFCHTKIQALYLQAWLSGQLGWQLQSTTRRDKEGLVFTYQGSSSPIEICLIGAQNAQLPPGLILSVEIEVAEEEHFFFYSHPEQLHQITLQHSSKESCDLPSHYIFAKAGPGHSLVKEICHSGSSEHFLNVLNLIKNMDVDKLC